MATHKPASTSDAEILSTVEHIRRNFRVRDAAWRRAQITAISNMITENRDALMAALHEDLGVNEFWMDGVELEGILVECKHTLAHLDDWMKPEKVSSPLLTLPASSYIHNDPYGVALLISPWNYPVSLLCNGLVAAIAGGNSVVCKPSEISVASSTLISRLIREYLDPEAVAVIEGAIPETTLLLKQKWDVIMYTGSTPVGKIVMRAAAEHLTPCLLELGGQCPAIVAPDADVNIAAKRIAWGKWSLNNAQTCVTVNHILVTPENRDALVEALQKQIKSFFGDEPRESSDVSRMINTRHTQRVVDMLDDSSIEIVAGGEHSVKDKYIAPTVVLANESSKVMESEIFGPILPIITVPSVDAAVEYVNSGPKPLALYVFSANAKLQKHIITHTSSGGVCVNDVAMHVANPDLPFGGVGPSGMGAYHGIHGFKAFTHQKAVFVKYGDDPSLRYAPYTPTKIKWLKRLRSIGDLGISKTHVILAAFAILLAVYFRFYRSRL